MPASIGLENLCITVFPSCRAAASTALDSPSVEEAVVMDLLGNWLLLPDNNSLEKDKNLEMVFIIIKTDHWYLCKAIEFSH
jgi:hypothetical protein